MKLIRYFIAIACVISLLGCASIVSESNYPVSISSSPNNAKISIKNEDGQEVFAGTTPTTITLDSSEGFFQPEEYTVTIKKKGYNKRKVTIDGELDGWYIGNIAFGGLIGFLIVDPATGAMWKLDKNVNINLPAKVSASNDYKLHIITLNQIPKHLKSKLVKVN